MPKPTGPPRYSSLFKFERANLYLKQLLKNASNGLPSIFKNYLISEYVSICIGTSLNNIAAMKDVLKDMPHDLNLFMHAPPAYLSSIHVDYNDNAPTVYTVQSSRINELRGRCYDGKVVSGREFTNIMAYAGEEAEEGALLDVLYREYLRIRARRTYRSFHVFLIAILSDNDTHIDMYDDLITEAVRSRPFYDSDLFTIKKVLLDNQITLR